jgi:hypothetical protein
LAADPREDDRSKRNREPCPNPVTLSAFQLGDMFKRLTKARRHSADEIGGVLPSPLSPGEEAQRVGPDRQQASVSATAAAYMLNAKAKFSRKSCGDAYTLLTQEDEGKMEPETDYRLVTAMPAFIVEHEPEKHRGTCSYLALLKNPTETMADGRPEFRCLTPISPALGITSTCYTGPVWEARERERERETTLST